MRAYKSYSKAKKAAGDKPILRIGGGVTNEIYVVGELHPWTGVEIIYKDRLTGYVTLSHLERLGNANHAKPNPKWLFSSDKAFADPEPQSTTQPGPSAPEAVREPNWQHNRQLPIVARKT